MLPLNLASDEGPIFVNAKQYHGILRRRKSRAKEMEKKALTPRKVKHDIVFDLHAFLQKHLSTYSSCGYRVLHCLMLAAISAPLSPSPCFAPS